LELELSALKSSCALLEAEAAAQRRLAESSSEAADAAAARAHSTLTQHIALKKKMKTELPQLADAIATARAERDAAVRQREADAAAIAAERSLMSSKLAGRTMQLIVLHMRLTGCLQHVPRKRTQPFPALGCCSSSASAWQPLPPLALARNARAGTCRRSSTSSSVISSSPRLLRQVHTLSCPAITCISAVPMTHPIAARDSEKVAWASQVQQLQLALAASKDEVAAVTSSCEQRLSLMTDQCKAAAAAAAASESSAKASAAQLHGAKQEVAASEARVHALAAQSIAAEAELAVEKEARAAAVIRADKAEADAAAASRRAHDAAAAAAAEVAGKELEVKNYQRPAYSGLHSLL
jgi:hypothetical protein